jgi:hypothetical protein
MDMQARGMKTLVHEHALVAVALAGILALTLAAGATLIVTGGISFGATGAQPAAPAHAGPSIESIQFAEENVFGLSGAYIGATSTQQIQFLEDNVFALSGVAVAPMSAQEIQFAEENVFSLSGAYAAPAGTEDIRFLEENTHLGLGGEVRLPQATSPRHVDY